MDGVCGQETLFHFILVPYLTVVVNCLLTIHMHAFKATSPVLHIFKLTFLFLTSIVTYLYIPRLTYKLESETLKNG